MSEKFLTGHLEQEVAEAEAEVEVNVVAAKTEILEEVRLIGTRLKELEARIERVPL